MTAAHSLGERSSHRLIDGTVAECWWFDATSRTALESLGRAYGKGHLA